MLNLKIAVDNLKPKVTLADKDLQMTNLVTENHPIWLQNYNGFSRFACNFYCSATDPITFKRLPHLIEHSKNGLLFKSIYIPGLTYAEVAAETVKYFKNHEEKLKMIEDPEEAREFDIRASKVDFL